MACGGQCWCQIRLVHMMMWQVALQYWTTQHTGYGRHTAQQQGQYTKKVREVQLVPAGANTAH